MRIGLNEEFSIGKSQLRGNTHTHTHTRTHTHTHTTHSHCAAHKLLIILFNFKHVRKTKTVVFQGEFQDRITLVWVFRAVLCFVLRLRRCCSGRRVQLPPGCPTGRVRQPSDPPTVSQPGRGDHPLTLSLCRCFYIYFIFVGLDGCFYVDTLCGLGYKMLWCSATILMSSSVSCSRDSEGFVPWISPVRLLTVCSTSFADIFGA